MLWAVLSGCFLNEIKIFILGKVLFEGYPLKMVTSKASMYLLKMAGRIKLWLFWDFSLLLYHLRSCTWHVLDLMYVFSVSCFEQQIFFFILLRLNWKYVFFYVVSDILINVELKRLLNITLVSLQVGIIK